MRFLTLYTPDKNAPPTAEHMLKMGAFMTEMAQSGRLEIAGGLLSAERTGLRAKLSNGAFSHGPADGASWMKANGFAILRAETREELLAITRRFLETAGDGQSEIIQLMDAPPQPQA